MGGFVKGCYLISSAYMFACAMYHLFITGSLFWEFAFIASSALNMGMYMREEDS